MTITPTPRDDPRSFRELLDLAGFTGVSVGEYDEDMIRSVLVELLELRECVEPPPPVERVTLYDEQLRPRKCFVCANDATTRVMYQTTTTTDDGAIVHVLAHGVVGEFCDEHAAEKHRQQQETNPS